MSDSNAKRLLAQAAREAERLRRHLLVAAALAEVLPDEPVVVGGTAEEYWTTVEYHETDLDLCVPLGPRAAAKLSSLGLLKEGRHWVHPLSGVAVEIPASFIDGDPARTVVVPLAPGRARIIGVEDLYLDRLRRATVDESYENFSFQSALAIAADRFEQIDWSYIRARLGRLTRDEPQTGRSMKKLGSRIERRVRRLLSPP